MKTILNKSFYLIIILFIITSSTYKIHANDELDHTSILVLSRLAEIEPSTYLEISEEEMGQLRWTMKLADDDLKDFSRIPSLNIHGVPLTGIMQLGFTSYRYSIAFNTYFLASVQYHKIPACPEIIQPRMDRLIQKMQQGAVWKYWAATSTGYFTFPFGTLKPTDKIFYKSERDPIKEKNVMYSGHLAHMISLYEKLYRDMKWSESNSIVFKWSWWRKYKYDSESLHRILRDAYLDLPDACIECEPNVCFPECNQHSILALKLYDQVHNTNFYEDVKERHMDWYLKNDIIDPITHNTCSLYLPLTGATLGPDNWDFGNLISLISVPIFEKTLDAQLALALADGWTMSFMNAWQPEYIRRHYPYSKKNRLDPHTGRVKKDTIIFKKFGLGMLFEQLAIPMYATLAAEMGDSKIKKSIIKQCDDYFKPQWEYDGSYYYPPGPSNNILNFSKKHWASSVTGAVVGIARSTPHNGLSKLHNDPVPGDGGPIVRGIDFARTDLRRAIYDSELEALIVSTDAGPYAKSNDVDTIIFDNLDDERTWYLKIDDEIIERFSEVSKISISIPLDGPHDIILMAE